MDANVIEIITSLIGSLGFPIVCVIFLWKYINTTMKSFTETMQENTKMLNRVCDKLDILSGDENKNEN